MSENVAMADPALEAFHPLVRDWFCSRFASPTDAQREGWPAIASGEDTLIAAPTGSGKTLTAFLASIDQLVRRALDGRLEEKLAVVYVSPLKALANDIQRNLEEPLREIFELANERGIVLPRIRTAVRSGDTPMAERQAMVKHPPHILITTPESLYLMLTADRSRVLFREVETLIVDEIHALVRDKRGSHLALTLARLDHVAERRPGRVGLSATQKPMDEIATYLTGSDPESGALPCRVLNLGHQRDLKLWIETMDTPLTAVTTHELWADIYDRLATMIAEHRTTLIFVNTRQLSERVAHRLGEHIGKEHVASHHGSLAKERRLQLEQRLKAGELKALVATASLELGIDIGSIDLVCQVGSPRRISTFLQRVGRSGHALGLTPHGALFPTTIDELVECAALIRAVRAGALDTIVQPVAPLEVLAQQIVAEVAAEEPRGEDDLFQLFRHATPYWELARETFEETLEMLAEGVGDGGGRSKPLIHRDKINRTLRARRGSRLTALVNGGVIPELGDYTVVKEPEEAIVGTVNEDFAIESNAGDIFLLGSTSWRIRRVESKGVVRVEDAHGAPPTIPFWLGEGPGRSLELSEAVGGLRRSIVDGLADPEPANERLRAETSLSETGAGQILDYIRSTRDALGIVPSDIDVVFERFFDEAGGQQLIVHAPFGSGINRAWGLALRKRFCVRFDFELQAAANDEGVILSLGPAQSFPLEEAFDYLKAANAEQALRQAVLYAPFWNTRWRWATTRALAVPRRRGGKQVAPFIQRMIADDLLAAVFPAQVGCQENLSGPLEVPDHPLIAQTMQDCLHEAVDTDGLVEILSRIEAGKVRLHARDTVEPSPMAQSVLNVNPYGFLDDAPLEERRARAVMTRRSLPESARDLGALDASAIDRVREETAPLVRSADELHDALLGMVAVTGPLPADWRWFDELVGDGRAATLEGEDGPVHFAAENLPLIQLLFTDRPSTPGLTLPDGAAEKVADREEARRRLVRGHMEVAGPLTAAQLGQRCGLTATDVERGLQQVEAFGEVLRGRYTTTGADAPAEYCDRRLLARIHRYTINRLRAEIEPVTAQDYARFLLRWQHASNTSRLQGKAGLREAIRRLQGFEAPAAAWERDILPSRVADYRPAWLDELCLAGEVTWARLTPRGSVGNGATPSRSTPITIALREDFPDLLQAVRWNRSGEIVEDREEQAPVGAAGALLAELESKGALFFDQLVRNTRRLATDVEGGLRELVARGLVHADGFEGLRQLTGKRAARAARRRPRYGGGGVFIGQGPAGRWALLPDLDPDQDQDELAERQGLVLLQRYGVVFRELAVRESFSLPWRQVLRALRRMEARGEIRGGRFLGGLIGEQFALPQAVEALRAVRRNAPSGERAWISATDPCNLSGALLPGPRIPARPGTMIALVDGVPVPDAADRPSSAVGMAG